jgi:flagellar motor switch protein FliN/FliY
MKQEKSQTQKASPRALTMDAWGVELARALTENGGMQPGVRKIPFDRNEVPADMLWWQASGSPAVWIGVDVQDAKLLPADLSDLLNRTWGHGEITDERPAGTEAWEVWNVQFTTGENVRFFVSAETTPAQPASNLDLLMDIELPVVIRFGRTQMALREVAALTPGSVIGFERGIDEPVELMINGHVVALGEAVTVKGAYGIRISEISSRRERLLTSSLAAEEQTL